MRQNNIYGCTVCTPSSYLKQGHLIDDIVPEDINLFQSGRLWRGVTFESQVLQSRVFFMAKKIPTN